MSKHRLFIEKAFSGVRDTLQDRHNKKNQATARDEVASADLVGLWYNTSIQIVIDLEGRFLP